MDPASLPPEARKHTPEGAAAFVKYFVEQTNEASVRADPTLVPPLSDTGCKSCASIQSEIESLHKAGRHYSSNPIEDIQVDAVPGGMKGQQLVRLRMIQKGADVVDREGVVVDSDAREDLAHTVSVVWRGESWVVYGIA